MGMGDPHSSDLTNEPTGLGGIFGFLFFLFRLQSLITSFRNELQKHLNYF